MISHKTRIWGIIILIIVVVFVSLYLNSRSVDSFHILKCEPKVFPKHGICEQECWYHKGKLVCNTFARGKPTKGCKNIMDKPGESEPYRCQLTTDSEGKSCMEELTPENVKYPYHHLPEEGTCKQDCYKLCQQVPPYTCKIECETTVNGSLTKGCENLMGCIGETRPYKCKLNSQRQCMDKV